ncbi:MAG: DUF1905 domain-containing protein [Chitinophagaceae bacterium]|jgi:hypothetical protein|nr:DUF1905 domain-containing protein [Chitinophagaceae bacterium]
MVGQFDVAVCIVGLVDRKKRKIGNAVELFFMKSQYHFSSKLWQVAEAGGWYFLSLPKKLSEEIRAGFKTEEEGWGRLKTSAQIGNTTWQTAIWFDTKRSLYLLPVKADVRKKENLVVNKTVVITLYI